MSNSQKLVVVGLDPGNTTGVAVLKGFTGQKYSSGTWDVGVAQYGMEEFAAFGREVVEMGFREVSSEVVPGAAASGWWGTMALAGLGMGMKVMELFSAELGTLDIPVDGCVNGVRAVLVLEDYVLRPDGDLGGRDAVSPVAVSAAFLALWMQMSNVVPLWSMPADKAAVGDDKLKRWFGAESIRGLPHGADALRHAVLAVRRVRAKR